MRNTFKPIICMVASLILSLVFNGCDTHMLNRSDSADLQGTPGTGDSSTVTVRILDSLQESRTAYPTKPEFTKFTLSFTETGGTQTHESITTTGTEVDILLSAGTWVIRAVAFTSFGGQDKPVASGITTVTIMENKTTEISIPVSPIMAGDDGDLACTINVAPGLKIDTYKISFWPFGDNANTVSDSGIFSEQGDSITKDFSVTPGYYVVKVTLTAGTTTATKTEVAHIASSQTTSASFDFGANDFVEVIKIAGTLTVCMNSDSNPMSVTGFDITAYSDKSFDPVKMIGETRITGNKGKWEIAIPKDSFPTVIHLRASGMDMSGNPFDGKFVDLDTTTMDLDDISLTKTIVNTVLSGTVPTAFLNAPATTSGWTVKAIVQATEESGEIALGEVTVDGDNSWSMVINPLPADQTITWIVSGKDSMGRIVTKSVDSSEQLGTTTSTGIEIDLKNSTTTLGGTYELYWNGEPVTYTPVIEAYTNSSCTTKLDAVFSNIAENNWTLVLPATAAGMNLYYKVTVPEIDGFSYIYTDTVSRGWYDATDIAIRASRGKLKLAGTATVTYPSSTPAYCDGIVYASTKVTGDSGILGSTNTGTSGAWSLSINAPANETDVYLFYIGNDVWCSLGKIEKVYCRNETSRTVNGTFNWMTLSGTISSNSVITILDLKAFPPDGVNAKSLINLGTVDSAGSTWTMKVPVFPAETEINFFAFVNNVPVTSPTAISVWKYGKENIVVKF